LLLEVIDWLHDDDRILFKTEYVFFKGSKLMSSQHLQLKVGLAEMLKGGVIMDVINAEQAQIAEESGAVAVMALERVPADIRREGGVARMASIEVVQEIMKAVTIPVMAKVRIGHFVEAQILESLGVDFIDESEVLTPADESFHVDKFAFQVPFVCGACNLGEALRRISEGAAMIRSKGEAGTGNVVEAVRHLRSIGSEIRRISQLSPQEMVTTAKELGASLELVKHIAKEGKLPVPLFSAGGVATPADAALMMQLGAETVFVGSGIFKSEDPAARARAIVKAVTHFQKPEVLLEVSRDLKGAMDGLEISSLKPEERLQDRGW
jgi:pyridoxal 5'-phosphate synthase pdxS subunit